jgi:hypothetical protein
MPAFPKPTRHRRNAAPSFDLLPAEGCKIRPPAWPFGKATADEKQLWSDLWHRPVAQVWHVQAIPPVVVARYVRGLLSDAGRESPRLLAALSRVESDLGLTPAALARLNLKVEPVPEPKAAEVDYFEEHRRRREASA